MCVYKVKVTQSCPTLCDPMNYTFHGILQARILEWVAFPFSEDLPDPRIRLGYPALQADSFPTEPSGKPHVYVYQFLIIQWGVCTHTHTHTHIHIYQFSSVAQLCSTLLRHHRLQHARLPCPSPTPGAYSDSCPLSQWCHPTISSSVIPFSSCPQSFSASGSFWISQFFTSGGQSIGVSASTSVLPMNTQDWSPLGWTGWISLQSKGLSRVFSSTTVQKHQFFGTQLSL